jgi:hypothetical protein
VKKIKGCPMITTGRIKKGRKVKKYQEDKK